MTTSQQGRIFISYRRADGSGYAGRIYDRLKDHFGKEAVFMDVDTIEAGIDFVEVLQNAVQSCDVLVALIGRQWLDIQDEAGSRRLEDPKDFVRIEVAAALRRNIRVIPVLIDGAAMPHPTKLPDALKALARRNALQVNHPSFDSDARRLISQTEKALEAAERTRLAEEKKRAESRELDLTETPDPEPARPERLPQPSPADHYPDWIVAQNAKMRWRPSEWRKITYKAGKQPFSESFAVGASDTVSATISHTLDDSNEGYATGIEVSLGRKDNPNANRIWIVTDRVLNPSRSYPSSKYVPARRGAQATLETYGGSIAIVHVSEVQFAAGPFENNAVFESLTFEIAAWENIGTEYTEYPPSQHIRPFRTTFTLGDDGYTEKIDIFTRHQEWLGCCLIRILETVGTGRPKRVTAFQVLLIDKHDTRVAKYVIMSERAFSDQALHTKFKPYGIPVSMRALEGTKRFQSSTIIAGLRALKFQYLNGGQNDVFERLILECTAWDRKAKERHVDWLLRLDSKSANDVRNAYTNRVLTASSFLSILIGILGALLGRSIGLRFELSTFWYWVLLVAGFIVGLFAGFMGSMFAGLYLDESKQAKEPATYGRGYG